MITWTRHSGCGELNSSIFIPHEAERAQWKDCWPDVSFLTYRKQKQNIMKTVLSAVKWRNTTEHTVPHRQSTAANKYGFRHCGSALFQLRMTFSHVIDHISFMSKCLVSQRCMHSAIKSFWVLPLLCDFHLNRNDWNISCVCAKISVFSFNVCSAPKGEELKYEELFGKFYHQQLVLAGKLLQGHKLKVILHNMTMK